MATTAADMAPSLRRRARRAARAGGDFPPPGSAVALRHRLFVSGTSGAQAFRGRAVAVAVGGAGPTRYLVDHAERGESRWIAETDIARSTALAPGDAVIGYVTVRDGGRPGATRASRASVRRACAREGWRLAGVVYDHERRAGGGLVAVNDDDVAAPPGGPTAGGRGSGPDRRPARQGNGARAIADALNEEGVATLGPDPLWRSWSVREAGGAWPPRGRRRRRTRL